MRENRKDDSGNKRGYRTSSSRLFQNQGAWYFDTREGITEGPYYDRQHAEKLLEAYVSVMRSNFSSGTELSLTPK